ncbi:ATP-binding cassette domain-containing protein [Arthrobacter echini]|uniref:ATP-binding cassette domain-containing protein n=1 Tax=Arthrobacter echini TaxID=1529066 RepID=A0A4S5E5L4_9MICC|nr:ABC transporter ATP-binding protein [Arthrobacter echini]THJ66730.1 ATP-binding cassette domain-containing protein [Arthrobacter echini]
MIRLEVDAFSYDGTEQVLVGPVLQVHPGDHVVVTGASGSGKTTLLRLLAGLTGSDAGAAFTGSITLDDERLDFAGSEQDPRIDAARWSEQVAYVAQGAWGQLSMMSATVGEEIAFGPANRGVPAGQLRARVDAVAESLGLTPLLERDPRRLSGGQLQRTLIAAAMVQRSRVLVLDEPFQGLDDDAAAEVAAALEVLRREGTGIVVSAPILPAPILPAPILPAPMLPAPIPAEAAPRSARVLALAGGRPVFDGSLADARTAGLDRFGIGTMGDPPAIGEAPERPEPAAAGAALLELRNVSFRYPQQHGAPHGTGLRGVGFSVSSGEIIALRGPNGSGKSTLLQHLNGLLRADSGSIAVDGTPIRSQPTGSFAAVVGYLFQDTDQQLFERTVLREVAYGPRSIGRRRPDAERRAAAALDEVGLQAVSQAHPYELGFVQRRLVALASLLATGPRLWALDEPTAGLDAPAREVMAALLRAHARGGGAVVLATHDAAFAETVAHRSLWLDDGRIVTQGGTEHG